MNRKLKILLISPLAAGAIVAANATRSDAFVLDTLKGLWNQTTNIVTSTLDYYVGDYVSDLADLYIPKGIEAVAGALGLPDPGGLFTDIRDEASQNKTEDNDIAAGDLEVSNVTRSFGKAVAEAHFAPENQDNLKQVSETYGKIAKGSADLTKSCQQQNITQEKINCTNQLLTNQVQGQQLLLNTLQQQGHLLSAGTLINSEALKHLQENAQAKQAQIEQGSQEARYAAQIYAAMGEGLVQTGDSPK